MYIKHIYKLKSNATLLAGRGTKRMLECLSGLCKYFFLRPSEFYGELIVHNIDAYEYMKQIHIKYD